MNNRFRQLVERAGGIYNGIQRGKDKSYIVFTDPMTKTTASINIRDATVQKIKIKLFHCRSLFKKYAEERRK